LVLGGVVVDEGHGLVATSDGDVAIHALTDALLGAAALGDLGTHFPSSDPRWEGSSSLDLLARAVELLGERGLGVVNVDVTIIAQSIRVAPHREAMRSAIAGVLGVGEDAVSVKATTTDGLGFLGRDEGIAALATATVH
jgi:2-C-methyl-D-erythritol 2,4-cyclodiphosphate synthase